mmetsp:Transcript_5930/g.20190  ORF Transcript_5930/g.20190 Transcript_5930/m.20190 type:complete len:311 (+) Transcript_5930:698-1630(+)
MVCTWCIRPQFGDSQIEIEMRHAFMPRFNRNKQFASVMYIHVGNDRARLCVHTNKCVRRVTVSAWLRLHVAAPSHHHMGMALRRGTAPRARRGRPIPHHMSLLRVPGTRSDAGHAWPRLVTGAQPTSPAPAVSGPSAGPPLAAWPWSRVCGAVSAAVASTVVDCAPTDASTTAMVPAMSTRPPRASIPDGSVSTPTAAPSAVATMGLRSSTTEMVSGWRYLRLITYPSAPTPSQTTETKAITGRRSASGRSQPKAPLREASRGTGARLCPSEEGMGRKSTGRRSRTLSTQMASKRTAGGSSGRSALHETK